MSGFTNRTSGFFPPRFPRKREKRNALSPAQTWPSNKFTISRVPHSDKDAWRCVPLGGTLPLMYVMGMGDHLARTTILFPPIIRAGVNPELWMNCDDSSKTLRFSRSLPRSHLAPTPLFPRKGDQRPVPKFLCSNDVR